MTESQSPVLHQRRLTTTLRQLREAAGKTQQSVADELEWSPSKLARIENGSVAITKIDLQALLRMYGVRDDETAALIRANSAVRGQKAWWSSYNRLLDKPVRRHLAYELEAQGIRVYEPLLIPGLLQTEEYANALLQALVGDVEKIRLLVEVRMRRQQEVLEGDAPPTAMFVLDEAVVRRAVGSPTIMRAQLEKLRDMAERENITLRIVPFDTGAHRGMLNSLTIFSFTDAMGEVVFLEGAGSLFVRDDPDELDVQSAAFRTLRDAAKSPEESLDMLDTLIAGLSGRASEVSATTA